MEQTWKSARKILPVVRGLILAYALTALLLVILAFLLYKMNLGEGAVNAGITGVYFLSCFFGGWDVGHKTGRKKYLWGFLTGVFYFLLLLGISAIFQPGAMAGLRSLSTAFLLCAGGGTLGGMLSR